jgi:hypothetical protein
MDLSKLSKKEKLELLDALEKKREIQKQKRSNYAPNEGQRPVHIAGDKVVRVVFSGNGAGKTALAVNEALWAAEGFNPITGGHTPVPARVLVILDKPEKVDMTWLPELRKWRNLRSDQLHKRGKPYITAVTFDNGSELLFMFHEQDPMSFESIELDFAVFDEPCPRHIYVALRRGGRTKGRLARYLLIGTPIAGSWQREDIYEPWSRGELPDTECFRFGTVVNEHNLAKGYIDSFSRVLTEKERLVRLEGMFHDIDGLGLAHLFSRKRHLLPSASHRWPQHYPCIVAIDPAMRKPHVALMLGVDKEDQLVVLREFALKAAPTVFAQRLKEWMRGFNIVDIVCDSMGSSELTGGDGQLSFIQVLRNNGVKARATSYDEKDDESWIQMIQQALLIPEEADNNGLHLPQLRILDNCTGLIHDIETVAWMKHRTEEILKPKLDISKKDFLACLKYALAARPRFDMGRERVIGSRRAGLRRSDRTFRS